MKTFLKTYILLVFLFLGSVYASQQQTQNIANLSAVSLYNIDKTALQDILKAYIKTHPNLKALKVTESLSGQTYMEFFRQDNQVIYNVIPKEFANNYKRYVTLARYENEDVGQIVAYYEDKSLISLSSKEQEWLDSNKIVLSVDDSYAPMNFRNSKNEMDGLSIDYIKMIEKKIGYTIQLDTNSWPVSLENAMTHQTDGIINANSTPQRDKKLIFTDPYAIVPMVLVTSNTEKPYNSLTQLKNKVILVKEKTVEATLLPKKYPSLTIKEVETYQEALMIVSSGNVFGVFGHMAVLEYEMHQFVLPNLKKNFVSFDEVVTKQAIGIRNSAPILRDILNKAIAAISDNEKKLISQKWMGKIDTDKNELTFQEIQWVKEHPVINIAVVDNYPPYDFRDANGNLIGFHSDIVKIINENLGTKVVLKSFPSWKLAFDAASKGSVHAIFSLSWSREREEKYFYYSSPYHFSPYYLVVDSDNRHITSLNDLENKIIAIEEKTIFKDVVLEKVPSAKIYSVKDTKSAYQAVLEGEAVATISPNINEKVFKQSGLKVASEIFHKTSNLYIGTNKQFPLVASILTKGIDSVSLKQLSQLRQKWLTKNSATIELNEEEEAWVRNNPTVKMTEFFEEPPFTLNGQKRQGYIYELLEYLIKSAGLKVDYVWGYDSYSDMLNAVETGSVDVLTTFPTSLKLDKNSNIVKSKAVLKTPFVIIGKTNGDKLKQVEDLYGYKVAVVKGYVQDKYLSKFPQIKKVYVNNNDEGFEAIRNGLADYYVNNRANTEFILNKSFFTDLQIIYELPYDKFPPLSISFAMNGQKQPLVAILNKALEQIPYKKLKMIRDKWILQTDSTSVKKVVFSEKEKNWLVENPAIRLAYMDYWPVDDNKDNIHTEYVGLLSKYGNVNITLVKYDAWKKGFEEAVKGNNSFGILNLSWSKERETKSFDYTKPYFFTPAYIVVKNDDTSIKSIKDLANKSVYVKENAITNKMVQDIKYNISPITEINEEAMYKALAQDNAKAPALLTYVYNPELLDKYDLKVANKLFSKFGEVHIGVSKQQPELHSILNKIYEVIPKSELSRIQNKVYKKTKKIKVALTKEEKAFIKSHKTIRVHNEKNWPPFNYYEFGQAKGYSVDLMKLVARNTGMNVEFITGPTWDEFLSMMKTNQLDVMINIVENEERLNYMQFTDPFIQASMGIAIHNDNTDIKRFDDILDKKVALEKGFFYHDYFKKNFPETPLVVVDDGLQTLQSVAFKNADATIGFVPVMKYIAEKNYVTDLQYFTDSSSPIMQPMPLRFSVNKNEDALLSILQKGLASVTPEEQKKLAKRWLGESSSTSKISIDLTKEEKEWIKENRVIKFTADPHYMPYEQFDNNGNYSGMVADYLKIIENALNIEFDKIPTKTWSESLSLAKTGQVDVLSNYTVDENLEDVHISTKPYISSPISIITKESVKSGITLDNLKGKKIAVIDGYGYLNNIFTKHPTLNYVTVQNAKEGLQGVSLGKYDAIICSLTLAKYKISELGLYNLHEAGQTGEIMRLGLGVRKDWDIFVGLVNKVLEATTPGMKQEINKRWLGENFKAAKSVNLSDVEQAWVNKKIAIKYVYDPDWAPFEWKNELGEHTGMIYDVLSLVSERTGLVFEPVATQTWRDAVKLAESRQVDMYGGLGENEERKAYMTFTKNSLYKTPYVFVVNKDNNKDYFDTFNSLSGDEKIAVVDGYTIHGIMKDKQADINIQTVKSTMEGFKQLTQKKIDIFLVNAATARYYINRSGFENLKIATKTEYHLEIKSAIRDDWPAEVISILDKALETITDKELADIYIKWTQLKVEKKVDWELIYEIAAGALALLLLIAFWNRKLKKAVDSKTAELKKLLESFDENVIASKTDTRGVIIYVSKAFCEISGYTEEELIGQPQCIVRHPDMPKSLYKDLWSTIQNGQTWRGEIKNRKKQGGFYWVEAIISPEFDESGKIIGYSAIRHDITSKKEVENLSESLEIKVEERTAELKESEKRFVTLFDAAPDSIAIIKDGQYISCNKKTLEMYGVESEEAFINSKPSTFSPKLQECGTSSELLASQKMKTAIKEGYHRFEWLHKRVDTNENFDAEVILSSISLAGEPHIYTVVRDITERKKLERQIKENKLFVDTLLDSQEQIVITTDGYKLRSCNKAFLDFFAIDSMEEFTREYDCICDRFEIDETNTYLQKYMDDKSWIEYILSHENETHQAVIVKDGQERTFTVNAAILPLGDEDIKSAVFTDITEIETIRKNIETILSNIMLPVLITSKKDRTILYANEYASKQYEASIDELVGKSIDSVYTSLDQKDEILDIMSKHGYVENLEERYKTQTGKEFIGLLSVKPILYNNEDAYVGMVVDITEQKQIEEEIRGMHKHTQSSIEYASLIQHSLIPDNETFRKYFDDYFTIWHPKDIVGGDIYLFEELRNEDECLLMVIDCTGHGVPGAFVTMLVKAIERQIAALIATDPNMEVSPGWILQYFNQTMKKLLKQENDDAISNAGFDGAVLYYNRKEQIVRFAGAELPLFYTDAGEFKIIKGNRHSIGYKKSDANFEFKEHLLEVKEGMQFYLSTDGYLDQNGGEKGFPFGKNRFIALLEEYKDYSFADKQEVLLNALADYQQDEERNDDITLVGVQIGQVDNKEQKIEKISQDWTI